MALKSKWPAVEIPENLSWAHYVLQGADKHGERTAIADAHSADRSYTYKQLKELAYKLGSALTRKGFKKGDVFAIMCPNIPEYPIVYFGVILIGGTVTSMNPLYTADEIGHQLTHSAAKWIITVPSFADKAKEGASKAGIDNVYVIGEADGCQALTTLLEDDGESFPENVEFNSKEDVACLPYSSGTTGLPKGVMLTHYNLIADSCITIGESFTGVKEDSNVLALLPFFHSYGLMINLANVLIIGGKIVCLPRFEPEAFLKTVQDQKITHAALVPPIILFLAKHPMVEEYDLSSLIDITCGAAAMGEELAKTAMSRLPNLKSLRQGYGMTELSPVSHVMPLDSANPSSVGVLLPNLECKIVDIASGEILPRGKDGEICVRGPTVMKGYLNNPEATARTLDSDGWLHTGDIGHYDEQEHFYVVDRLKELIKYKGFQVPPAELEGLLLSHPDVEDAAVIGIPDEEAGELPKAFIVRKGDLTEQDISSFINEKVAPYKKLRGGVEFVDKIPKSASGKILRRELKERELNNSPRLANIMKKRDSKVLRSKYPDVVIPDDVTLTEFVMERFDNYGNVTAITDTVRERSYTYSQLKDLIMRCSSGLMRAGMKKGDVLGMYMPNTPEFPIVFLATMQAGGIVTPINPLYTEDELAHQLKLAGAKYVVTILPLAHRAKDAAKASGISSVYVFGDADGCESMSKLLEDDGSSYSKVSINAKEDVAVMPFSSGTTGLPKGVMLTHYNLVADGSIVCAEGFLDYSESSVILAFLPFFHSNGMVTVLSLGLRRGSTLVCMTKFERDKFLLALQEHNVSHVAVVPPVALMLAKDPSVDNYDLSSLVEITSGAAPLGREVSQAVLDRLPLLSRVRQGYGMTELSPVCHLTTINNTKHGTVGQLLPNLECKVVDVDNGDILATGATGELCVRGPTQMKGYLNNPEATARTIDEEGWLHTGDIGYYDIDENFYIVDRLKELIKYKGYQVPPAELEALLVSHPNIQDAAVIGVPDQEAGELPRAYVVTDGSLTENDIIKFVEENVAPYKKLRGGVVFVDEVPRSLSGKILRRELRDRLQELTGKTKDGKRGSSIHINTAQNSGHDVNRNVTRNSSCCVLI